MQERSQEAGDETKRVLEIYRKERHDERKVSDDVYRRLQYRSNERYHSVQFAY